MADDRLSADKEEEGGGEKEKGEREEQVDGGVAGGQTVAGGGRLGRTAAVIGWNRARRMKKWR
jgi:hypothetical protein